MTQHIHLNLRGNLRGNSTVKRVNYWIMSTLSYVLYCYFFVLKIPDDGEIYKPLMDDVTDDPIVWGKVSALISAVHLYHWFILIHYIVNGYEYVELLILKFALTISHFKRVPNVALSLLFSFLCIVFLLVFHLFWILYYIIYNQAIFLTYKVWIQCV